MWTWLKNLFSRSRRAKKRLGDCVLGADTPEEAVTVAITWLAGGRVSAYPKGEFYDIHIYEATAEEHNGFYQLQLDKVSPKDVLGLTLDEFIAKFKVSSQTIEIEEIT